jgi:hypothetical protein
MAQTKTNVRYRPYTIDQEGMFAYYYHQRNWIPARMFHEFPQWGQAYNAYWQEKEGIKPDPDTMPRDYLVWPDGSVMLKDEYCEVRDAYLGQDYKQANAAELNPLQRDEVEASVEVILEYYYDRCWFPKDLAELHPHLAKRYSAYYDWRIQDATDNLS